jgi:hypothetical protein
VTLVKNRPLVTHAFWDTNCVPKNVCSELFRRIEPETVWSCVIKPTVIKSVQAHTENFAGIDSGWNLAGFAGISLGGSQ